MQMSEYHYLPLAPAFFFILVGIFFIVFVLLLLGVLRSAYLELGVSSRTAFFLLLASLIGSYFNIPIAELPPGHVVSDEVRDYFGMHYMIPHV
ncbi:MAG TPA: hypothetical protein VK442_01915, partial [Xanthobacteraceae bacterium]|nr:hypothetical protein [Xanthobacteraceae bacterium]